MTWHRRKDLRVLNLLLHGTLGPVLARVGLTAGIAGDHFGGNEGTCTCRGSIWTSGPPGTAIIRWCTPPWNRLQWSGSESADLFRMPLLKDDRADNQGQPDPGGRMDLFANDQA